MLSSQNPANQKHHESEFLNQTIYNFNYNYILFKQTKKKHESEFFNQTIYNFNYNYVLFKQIIYNFQYLHETFFNMQSMWKLKI